MARSTGARVALHGGGRRRGADRRSSGLAGPPTGRTGPPAAGMRSVRRLRSVARVLDVARPSGTLRCPDAAPHRLPWTSTRVLPRPEQRSSETAQLPRDTTADDMRPDGVREPTGDAVSQGC